MAPGCQLMERRLRFVAVLQAARRSTKRSTFQEGYSFTGPSSSNGNGIVRDRGLLVAPIVSYRLAAASRGSASRSINREGRAKMMFRFENRQRLSGTTTFPRWDEMPLTRAAFTFSA